MARGDPELGRALRDADEARRFFTADLAGRAIEALRVAHLDRERRLLGVSSSESAISDAIALPIRAIASDAIAFGSTALILAHNHPSGDPTPSAADIAATRDLVTTMRGLGVRVLDHLILAANGWRSFRAMGLL